MILTDLRTWLTVALALLQSGCGALYVAQAARGQWQVMSVRRPIEQVLADPNSTVELRARLERVRLARQFAVSQLSLPDNKSYTTYADIGRDYVVWNVVATPEFAVGPLEWCFPVAGCVAYRGYFAERRAREFAARLKREGNDVRVQGVPAYSTLGRFADPVLNTMLSYGDDELTGMVFHELAHQVVYLPGDTAFNEAFAVTVEQEGLARWLTAEGRADNSQQFRQRLLLRARVVAVVARYRDLLDDLYQQAAPDDRKRERKAKLFIELANEVAALQQAAGVTSPFADELARDPNNAWLASLATYYECVPGFQRLLVEEQHDLSRFFVRVRELTMPDAAARRVALCEGSGAHSGG